MANRPEFESWVRETMLCDPEHLERLTGGTGSYRVHNVQCWWMGWQAGETKERDRLLSALRWALREGARGFYTVEDGAETWYYCRFCHAVADQPEKLRHEDACAYFHAKKQAVAETS
jgi:hypothetical protein